jgi:hypothetical protein
MDLVTRARNICLNPVTEWNVIAGETTPRGTLVAGYVLPLAGLGVAAGFIGGSIIGQSVPFVGHYRAPITTGLAAAVLGLAFAIAGVFILALIINALAPTFGGEKNNDQAFKVAVYSYTPAWIAGILNILPLLGILALIGALYGIYLLYLGLPRLMKAPADKAVGYTAVVVVCALVVSVILGLISASVVGAGRMAGLTRGAAPTAAAADPDSPLGRLEQMGRRLEQSSQRMAEAEKSGDANAQMAAAMEGMGALFGGGRRVEPVAIDQLRAFVPETMMGLPRTRTNAERTGLGPITATRAEATYGDGERSIELEIVDSGGASGLMGLASWVGVEGEREDDTRVERTRRVAGRLVHEERSKVGGSHTYAILLGERFMVSADARGIDFAELEAAVSRLDLEKLEAMKDAGVQ